MARQLSKLNARRVSTVKKAGRYSDGGGLFLVVSKRGAKRWAYMSWAGGRQIEHGLGGLASVSLAMARERAAECRRLVSGGRNPIEARRAKANVPMFGEMAEMVIAALESGWCNEKHRAQWRSTIATYAAPLAQKRVDAITTEDVLAVLKPVWTAKAETAGRLRGTDRENPRCCQSEGASDRGKPRALARSPRSSLAQASEASARAPCGNALEGSASLHNSIARSALDQLPRA